jgi:very-short-patch-repair endonuclease
MTKKSQLEETLALHMRAVGLSPEREYRFHPVRKWRFDFAFPDQKIAVECEGGTWMKKGGHTTGVGFEKDCYKYNRAALEGWAVLRFTGRMIVSGDALAHIEQALAVIGVELDDKCRCAGL